MKHLFLAICVCISCVSFAAEPYLKTDVPWAVYLPKAADDDAGYVDANVFLHGEDEKGWYTFMVFKNDGTLITNNADLYDASGDPIINMQDDYEDIAKTIDGPPDYIITKYILIQPTKTPSVGIAGGTSSYVNTAAGSISVGHEPDALGYKSQERKLENVSLAGDYWLSAKECPKKLWRLIHGDSLYGATLSDDLLQFLTSENGATNNTLATASEFKNWVETSDPVDPTDKAQLFVKHELPVYGFIYSELTKFFSDLNAKASVSARLPNEFEFEYTARAGDTAELPSLLYSPAVKTWYIAEASDVDEKPVQIEDVFEKAYDAPDLIPAPIVDTWDGLVTVGTTPEGVAIKEYRTVGVNYLLDPRLNTYLDYRIIIHAPINYDIRYSAKMNTRTTRNLKQLSSGAFQTANINPTPDDADNPNNMAVSVTSKKGEYFANEEELALAVAGFYIGVKEDGSYAARNAIVGDSTSEYIFDYELVHHFVRMNGKSIFPPNHPTSSPMNAGNTVLAYCNWVEYDTSAKNLGYLFNPANSGEQSSYDLAKQELENQVLNHDFPNLGGKRDLNKKVTIPEKSSIKDDVAHLRKDKGGIVTEYHLPKDKAANGWNHVSAWTVHGNNTIIQNQEDWRIDNGYTYAQYRDPPTPRPGPGYPIDGFNSREKAARIRGGENSWGFSAMLGNLSEICLPAGETSMTSRWDGFTDYKNYTNTGDYIVTRGGSWNSSVLGVRYSNRVPMKPDVRSNEVGFRILIEQ